MSDTSHLSDSASTTPFQVAFTMVEYTRSRIDDLLGRKVMACLSVVGFSNIQCTKNEGI